MRWTIHFGGAALLAAVLSLGSAGGIQAQTPAASTVVSGRVVDAESGEPVRDARVALEGAGEAVTDARGVFLFAAVRPGRLELRVEHLGYGGHARALDVPQEGRLVVHVAISPQAIALQPVVVRSFSLAEREDRGRGATENLLTRDLIDRVGGTTMNMADLLRQHVPGIRVRRVQNLAGSPICVEFRGASGSPNRCRSPAVYLDGVPITQPETLYESLSLEWIESIEIVPRAEAGVRYGSGALWGALLIRTRPPGRSSPEEAPRFVASGPRSFDWEREPAGHAWERTFLLGLAGNAAGLAAGLTLARQCIHLRAPVYDQVDTRCGDGATLGAVAAAVALPALSASLAARLGGRTELSEGEMLPAAVGAAMMLFPGYGLLLSSRNDETDPKRWIGIGFVSVGVPLATTLADRWFRRAREGADGSATSR